jgi:hypothetical protein
VIYNSLSIHSQCFKGNENEENFWFDDPWNASMEEAVPAKIQDENFREEVRRTMEEKERSQGKYTKTEGRYKKLRERYRKGDTGEVLENAEIFCPNGGYFENQDKMRG